MQSTLIESLSLTIVDSGVSVFHEIGNVRNAVTRPLLSLFQRLNYVKWIKKFMLTLLAIQFFVFVIGMVYYALVFAATMDDDTIVMNIIVTTATFFTGGVFVLLSILICPPQWCFLADDGSRLFMKKRFTMKLLMIFIITMMIVMTCIEGTIVGFNRDFDFVNDDDQDAFEGVSDQEFEGGFVLTPSFDVYTNLVDLPTYFTGSIVSSSDFETVWVNRTNGLVMFILCALGLYTVVTRTEPYLVARRLSKIQETKQSVIAHEALYAEIDTGRKYFFGDMNILLWLLLMGAFISILVIVNHYLASNDYYIIGLYAGIGSTMGAILLGAWIFGAK